jgi:hypothetical protein
MELPEADGKYSIKISKHIKLCMNWCPFNFIPNPVIPKRSEGEYHNGSSVADKKD